MEESVSLRAKLKEEFNCGDVDIRTYSPLTLAYIGDGIYELIIRTVVVGRGNRAPQGLHKATTGLVKAETQAEMAAVLWDELTEVEQGVYRRGRNAKSFTSARNATIADYRKSTGLEALFGYLYLTEQTDRLIALVKEGLSRLEMEI